MKTTSLLAALALLGALHGAALAQQTIKLGVISIEAGPLAVSAGAINDGAALAVERLNAGGGALGRKYELVIQGHDGPPAGAIAAATKLVRQQGVSFFTGISPSGNSLAVSAKLADLDALYLDATAASDDLTGKNCNPNYFRVGISDSSQVQVWRELAQRHGAKTFDLLMADIAAARDASRRFVAVLPSIGGSVGKEIFAPLSTTDFGGQIAQLQAKPADSLVMYMPGSAGIALSKQQAPFGLFDKYKLVLGNGFATDFQLDALGDNVLGVYNTLSWTPELAGARNAQYVKEFERIAKRRPFYTDADMMAALETYRAGVIKAGSTDPDKVRKALEGLKVDTIFGSVDMRAADHHLIRQHGMAQVVKGPGGKNVFQMKVVKPGPEIYPPASPECKIS